MYVSEVTVGEDCELAIPWCEKVRHQRVVRGSGVTLGVFDLGSDEFPRSG
jgi:hypothetical protein